MKIICDRNMPFAREAFSTLGDVRMLDGRALSPADVRDADILAIRSTTRVNRELLERSRVRFVGTATIGTEHLDVAYLESRGIHWCFAPGCNSNSVSEYVTSALLCLAARHGFSLANRVIGVIGVGHVGSLVVRKAEALGMRVLRNDPPRARAEAVPVTVSNAEGSAGGSSAGDPLPAGKPAVPSEKNPPFVPLEQLLAESDVITLHVPLTTEGTDATFHLADCRFFDRVKTGCIFLNSARGIVVETDALLTAMNRGVVAHAVIDTWEDEPAYRPDLLNRADLGTPHIAGHSFEGKAMGTVMVYREACRFLGVEPAWTSDDLWPQPLVPTLHADAAGRRDEDVVWDIVRRVYDIEDDDRRFRQSGCADARARAARFDELRRNYPMRREFRFTGVTLGQASPGLAQRVAQLGFQLA